MAQHDQMQPRILNCDAYYENVQSKKKLQLSSQESLTAAFAQIPASSFPHVPGGKVIEIPAETSIIDAVRILSENNITAAPVTNPSSGNSLDWREQYLGVIDYSTIIFWILNGAEHAAIALQAGLATTAGVGAGALGALGVGAVALGATGPLAAAGLILAAIGATVAGGLAAESDVVQDDSTSRKLNDDLYKAFLQEEPFKSTTVISIVKSYAVPFLPVAVDSSMLTVLLLLSKYGLRNIPVIDIAKPFIKNFITQSEVVKGLQQCKGSSWFDCIAARPLSDLGLPFMSSDEVVSINDDELILEAFKRMKDNQIGGLPVLLRGSIVGSVSISDIKYLLLRPRLFSDFSHLTAMDFIKTVGLLDAQAKEALVRPVTCLPDACLGSVIESLSSRSVTRLYVVKKDGLEILGVVTLRDVISCFLHEPPGHLDKYLQFATEELLN